jgi:type VI protein secretion system component Hcp
MKTPTWPRETDASNLTDFKVTQSSLLNRILRGAAFLTLLSLSPLAAPAALIFLNIPGIDGGQSTPGFSGAIAVQSLDIMPGQFTIIKTVDSASPGLFNAVVNGTVFPSAYALLYNSAPTGSPDATLTLQNVVATSATSSGGALEQVGFVATNLGSVFLELPGITGESSTPGHAGVMQIDSFSLTANQFSIFKVADSASPQILSAVATGTTFGTASILFYSTAIPTGSPASVFTFGDIVGTSHLILNGGTREQDTFSFGTVTRTAGVLENISTRSLVGIGQNVTIAGFIIDGTGPKQLVLRALGPTLAQFGIAGFLQDPTLELHNSAGMVIASNDDWAQAANAQSIPANLQPSDNHEAALLVNLTPGAYTAIVRGVNNSTGVALVEAYDIAAGSTSRLSNISTRGFVQTGGNVMIAGVIIQSNTENVLVRALGPTLTSFGITNALANPTLELRDANGTFLTANDNWKSTQQAEISATGKAPPNDLESAIARTLAPGNYTAIVRGVNNTTGVALVEVYALQ